MLLERGLPGYRHLLLHLAARGNYPVWGAPIAAIVTERESVPGRSLGSRVWPLTASGSSGKVALTGEFGVFFPGQLEARFYDRQGSKLGAAPVQEVTPFEILNLQQTVQAPADTARVSLHLVDRNGLDRGPLGETVVSLPSGGGL